MYWIIANFCERETLTDTKISRILLNLGEWGETHTKKINIGYFMIWWEGHWNTARYLEYSMISARRILKHRNIFWILVNCAERDIVQSISYHLFFQHQLIFLPNTPWHSKLSCSIMLINHTNGSFTLHVTRGAHLSVGKEYCLNSLLRS
jgi:hypothetical protein